VQVNAVWIFHGGFEILSFVAVLISVPHDNVLASDAESAGVANAHDNNAA
jgi:hypothetical protein